MKNNISKLGALAGFTFTLGSFVRYFIMFPDWDRLVSYCTIGVLIVAVSWLYDKHHQNKHNIEAIENYLSDKEFVKNGNKN